MKQLFTFLSIISILIACNNQKPQDKNNMTTKSGSLQFASYTDTICHMPVDETVTDTIILDNKILGFCGPNCRDGFMQILKEQHKR